MAILKSLSMEMVRQLSGVVDFYYWKGIPVARTWPRKSSIPPSAAMLVSRSAFIQSRADLKNVSGVVRGAWASSAVGRKQAWLDYYTAIYLRIFKEQKVLPPVVQNFVITTE